jgi:hypothetical protein
MAETMEQPDFIIVGAGSAGCAVATDRAELGEALSGGLAARPATSTNPAIGGRSDRGTAPRAIAGQGDRQDSGCLSGNGQPDLETARTEQAHGAGTAMPARRYERQHPGELIHIGIKKFSKFDKIGHRITSGRTGRALQPTRPPEHRLQGLFIYWQAGRLSNARQLNAATSV